MSQYDAFIKELCGVCEQFGEKTAITYMHDDGNKTYTSYKKLFEGCKNVERKMLDVGIVAGDRVAIVSPHSPQSVLASLGLAFANVTTVLIDASLPLSEINRLLEFADVRGIFVTEALYDGIDENIKRDIPVFQLCKRENEYNIFKNSITKVNKEKTIDPETDVIAILFSSGTTAQMKGIKVKYESVIKASNIFIRNVKWKAEYKYLHVFPLNHIAGYATVNAFLSCGSELGMIENMNAAKLQEALLEYQPHGFGMIPKVFEMMEDKIRDNIKQKGKLIEGIVKMLLGLSGSVRKHLGINIGKYIFPFITGKVFGKNIIAIGTGATLCRKSTSKFFIDMGLVWANFYASTETNVPAVSTGIYDKYPVLMAGNIKRNPEIQVKINNPDSAGIGEIYVKSELLMKGYFRDDEQTKSSFEGDYFKTGDYGYVDAKGNLYVTGRVKESILLHSGKKISPTDIENYYRNSVPQVDIACCGCSKENKNYDEVYMFVQEMGKTREEIDSIISKLREKSDKGNHLYKLDYIIAIEKLPLTTVGKVKRFELQKYAKSERISANVHASGVIEADGKIEKIIFLIKKIIGRDERIESGTRIKEDLCLDSLSIFELQTEMEMCFNTKIAIDWSKISTVQDIVNAVEAQKITIDGSKEIREEQYLINRSHKDIRRVKHLIFALNRICKVKYEGLENVIDEPCILVANHSSHLDIMCIYKAIRLRYGYKKLDKVCCLAAKELVKQRGMNKTFRALGAIPVDRKGNAAMSIVTLNKYIKEYGYIGVAFPEGTRTRSGKIGKFANGVASSAIATNVPIVPIGIKGSYEIWSANRKKPKLSFVRKEVTVSIGKPIYPTDLDASKLTGIVRENVETLCEE